ncbi:hypothetical protein C4580_03085 [Candidatus Woesearchaeota archaeon]|nr:MAG: hypothetical protein C4580_03085 [Candidatus Woesearchaeota archaeon]
MNRQRPRLRPILPTLKEKKRYLAFEILSNGKMKDFSDVSRAIWGSLLSFVGTRGAGEMGVIMIPEKYNAKRQRGLIRVAHTGLDTLRASLALVQKVGDDDAIVRSLGASGILMKAHKKFVEG